MTVEIHHNLPVNEILHINESHFISVVKRMLELFWKPIQNQSSRSGSFTGDKTQCWHSKGKALKVIKDVGMLFKNNSSLKAIRYFPAIEFHTACEWRPPPLNPLQQPLQPQLLVPSALLSPRLLRLTVPPGPSAGWLNTRGFWDRNLWATVIKMASTWSLLPRPRVPSFWMFEFFADVSNRGIEWVSANCCATSVPTWMESWRSHLFPTKILGTSVPRACCLHSSIHAGRLRKLVALVTS